MQTYHQLRQQRAAIVNWTTDDRISHALTLNTDRELSAQKLSEIFGCFCHLFDKAICGRNLSRVASEARLYAIAFPENLATNAHLHAVADLSSAITVVGTEAKCLRLAKTCWLRATKKAGTFYSEAKPDRGWGGYCTKRFTGTYFLSADYWPH